MTTVTKKQDLPPPGGYQKIQYKRIPAKSYIGGWPLIAGYLGMTFGGLYIYYLTYKQVTQNEIESRSAKLAMYPLLLAERDRAFLRQLRRNREEEKELMKNVEGWEVGTWYGEPIFKTMPEDKFVSPSFYEYYIHAKDKFMKLRANIKLWS